MSFSKNLATALNERKMTVDYASGRTGITSKDLNMFLNGIVEPDPSEIQKIADVLNVTVKDLGGDDDLTFTSFGAELKAMRERQGLTVSEASKLLGVSHQLVLDIERDVTSSPQKKTMSKYADLFGDEFMAIKRKYFPQGIKKHVNSGEIMTAKPDSPMEAAKAEAIKNAINMTMEKKKITNFAFCKRIGISHKTLEKIRIHGYLPTQKLYERIVEVLGYEPTAVRIPCKEAPAKPVAKKVEKPVAKTAENPVVEVIQPPKKATTATGFRREWADLLRYIDSDAEYRKATEALFKLVFDDTDVRQIDGCPQANMVLKMAKATI